MNKQPIPTLLVLCVNFIVSSVCSLPSGTKILTAHEAIPIERLIVGEVITSFNAADSTYPEITIKEIIVFQTPGVIEIKTPVGSVSAAPEQEFYDIAQDAFIPACNLNKQSILVSRSRGIIKCEDIFCHNNPTKCYKVSLKGPDLYFSSDLELLTYNFALVNA